MINGRLFENMDDIYQQDGAAWHTATAIIDLLQSKFGDKVISRNKHLASKVVRFDTSRLFSVVSREVPGL